MTALADTVTIRRAEYDYTREKLNNALATIATLRDELDTWRGAACPYETSEAGTLCGACCAEKFGEER